MQSYVFLSFPVLWSFSYFFLYIYLILLSSIILYVISNIKDYLFIYNTKNYNSFLSLVGFDLFPLCITPLIVLVCVLYSWKGPLILSWFGHLIFYTFQLKLNFFILLFFYLILLIYTASFYFSSYEIYDYLIVIYNFSLWVTLLFLANNLFTFIFFIEVLSTLITLMLISSVFSSAYFYNNLSFSNHSYFNSTTPFTYLQTLLFFFWISLISSLNLFIYLFIFYLKFFSFDWFLLENVFLYIIQLLTTKSAFYLILAWFNIVFCIFLKCGLAPFYFWKPLFFKGTPIHTLLFYIVFFYFFLFFFIIYFFLVYMNDLFYFNTTINLALLIVSSVFLIFIVLESYYIKTFLAISSIINTVFVFLAMVGFSVVDFSLLL